MAYVWTRTYASVVLKTVEPALKKTPTDSAKVRLSAKLNGQKLLQQQKLINYLIVQQKKKALSPQKSDFYQL